MVVALRKIEAVSALAKGSKVIQEKKVTTVIKFSLLINKSIPRKPLAFRMKPLVSNDSN